MKLISLQSGSNGNCLYIEAGDVKLLVDAGISGICAQRRLASHGRDIHDVDAVIISHDHADHAKNIGVYQRKFNLPVCVTKATLAAAGRHKLGELREVRFFRSGRAIRVGGATIETIRTPHDAADSVALVIDDGDSRLGILTDLGHIFDGLADVIATLDAVLIESNYDPRKLAGGPYPQRVKARITSDAGHLANAESAGLLAATGGRLRWACLGHLSEANNTPELAMAASEGAVGGTFPLYLAGRYEASGILEV